MSAYTIEDYIKSCAKGDPKMAKKERIAEEMFLRMSIGEKEVAISVDSSEATILAAIKILKMLVKGEMR